MWPFQLAFLHFIVCRMFTSSSTLSNTSSFFTRSLQVIFFVFLQHHISRLYRYFWSTFRSVQVSAPYNITTDELFTIVFPLTKPLVYKAGGTLTEPNSVESNHIIKTVHRQANLFCRNFLYTYWSLLKWNGVNGLRKKLVAFCQHHIRGAVCGKVCSMAKASSPVPPPLPFLKNTALILSAHS